MDRFSLAALDFNVTGLAVVRLIACLVLGSASTVVAVTLVSS